MSQGNQGKPGKTQGILFECNYFDFVQTLIGVSYISLLSLIKCIFIFIMQLPLYLNDL